MAKNFTDFQEITGSYTAPDPQDGGNAGVRSTQANEDMYLVGYAQDEPHGERRFTIESVLLTAEPYHLGLDNVTNESKEFMFNDSVLTGSTSADDLIVKGNLRVEGATVQLNTENFATSAFNVINHGTKDAFYVRQDDPASGYNIAQFWYGQNIGLEINDIGNVGIKRSASDIPGTALSINGNVSAAEIFVTGEVDGRHLSQDGAKLDNIKPWSDVTAIALSAVSTTLNALRNTTTYQNIEVGKAMDLIEDGENYKKIPALSSTDPTFSKQKIVSIEPEADVTGDHSADIIYNDVPDGPWISTSTTSNTFVKTTSAEVDRLRTVRGVVRPLHQSDPTNGTADIDRNDIVKAYQQGYPDFWSTQDDFEYRNTIVTAATAAVQNFDGVGRDDGVGDLNYLNVRNSLTANNPIMDGSVSVLSGGNPMAGITAIIPLGQDTLHFIDGILVKWEQ